MVEIGSLLKVIVSWSIPNTEDIHAGDYFVIPLQVSGIDLETTNDSFFSLKDNMTGEELGRWGVTKVSDGHYGIICSLNDKVENLNALKDGSFFAQGFLQNEGDVVIDVVDGGEPVKITVGGGSTDPGFIYDTDNLRKGGWQGLIANDTLNWEVKINTKHFTDLLTGRTTDLQALKRSDALLVDELAKGQTLSAAALQISWPIVAADENGDMQAASPYFIVEQFSAGQEVVYQEGETESQFKDKVRNAPAPSYGVSPPQDKHTDEANHADDGDYVYFNLGDLPGTVKSTYTRADILATIDQYALSDDLKQTTKDAYTRYFDLLQIGDDDYVPAVWLMAEMEVNLPEGSPTQDVTNAASLEYRSSTPETTTVTVKYTGYDSSVGSVEKGHARIVKLDEATNARVPNVEFGLYKKTAGLYHFIEKQTTDKAGTVDFAGLGIGEYAFVEQGAQGYDPTSLAVKDGQGGDIAVKGIEIGDVAYPGFELAVVGDETAGFGYVATNARELPSITLSADKHLVGKDLQAGAFSFTLEDDTGARLETASNDSEGTIEFAPLSYTEAGVHTYTIAETEGDDPRIAYDTHTIKVKVTVEDQDGVLTATAHYDGDRTFVNTYDPETPSKEDPAPLAPPSNTPTPSEPATTAALTATGDSTPFIPLAVTALTAVLCATAAVLTHRNRRSEA